MQDIKKRRQEDYNDLFIIEPVEKLVLIDRIIASIGRSIEKGILKPGDYLPGERSLSKRFDVNRTTIRLALKALEFLGVLEISPGKRTRISDSVTGLFKNPFKFLNIMHNITLEEIFETRRIIEVEVVKKATKTACPEDINELDGYLKESEKYIHDREAFMQAEFDFHRQLLLIARNRIFTAIMINLNNLLLILERYEGNFIDIETRKASVRQHKAILECITKRDKSKAAHSMLYHINTMYKRLSDVSKDR